MKQTKISDAELVLMEHIWEKEGIRAAQLVQLEKHHLYATDPHGRKRDHTEGGSRVLLHGAGQQRTGARRPHPYVD